MIIVEMFYETSLHLRQVNCHADDEDRNQDSHGYQQDYGTSGPMCEFEKCILQRLFVQKNVKI